MACEIQETRSMVSQPLSIDRNGIQMHAGGRTKGNKARSRNGHKATVKVVGGTLDNAHMVVFFEFQSRAFGENSFSRLLKRLFARHPFWHIGLIDHFDKLWCAQPQLLSKRRRQVLVTNHSQSIALRVEFGVPEEVVRLAFDPLHIASSENLLVHSNCRKVLTSSPWSVQQSSIPIRPGTHTLKSYNHPAR